MGAMVVGSSPVSLPRSVRQSHQCHIVAVLLNMNNSQVPPVRYVRQPRRATKLSAGNCTVGMAYLPSLNQQRNTPKADWLDMLVQYYLWRKRWALYYTFWATRGAEIVQATRVTEIKFFITVQCTQGILANLHPDTEKRFIGPFPLVSSVSVLGNPGHRLSFLTATQCHNRSTGSYKPPHSEAIEARCPVR